MRGRSYARVDASSAVSPVAAPQVSSTPWMPSTNESRGANPQEEMEVLQEEMEEAPQAKLQQPQAPAGQVPELPSDCLSIMPKIRALAAAAGQPMSMGPPWPNPARGVHC